MSSLGVATGKWGREWCSGGWRWQHQGLPPNLFLRRGSGGKPASGHRRLSSGPCLSEGWPEGKRAAPGALTRSFRKGWPSAGPPAESPEEKRRVTRCVFRDAKANTTDCHAVALQHSKARRAVRFRPLVCSSIVKPRKPSTGRPRKDRHGQC